MADGQQEETWGAFLGKWAGRALIAGGAIATVSFLGAPALSWVGEQLDSEVLTKAAGTVSSYVAGIGNTLGADVFSDKGLAAIGATKESVLSNWDTMVKSVQGIGSEIYGAASNNWLATGAVGAGALGAGLLLSSSKPTPQRPGQPVVGAHTAKLQASYGGYGVGVNAGRNA